MNSTRIVLDGVDVVITVSLAAPPISAWNFSVEVATNLMDWTFFSTAFPIYQFLDPLSTNAPQRHYRLRWP